jgi:squalene-hopene/tetraprenyl-beta-curcumene cyclase
VADTVSTHAVRVNGSSFRFDSAHVVPSIQAAIDRARRHLLARQADDGHWCGELQGDTILESEWILLLAFLGREQDPRVAKAARYLLLQQNDAGGWANYPGGPSEISVSVKAYFALKIAGHDADAPHMRRALAVIRELGGAGKVNSFTKFYLALLGQLPYKNCPAVPPEIMLLPKWSTINLYSMSAWTRTIVVPLSIFYAHKPVRRLPVEKSIAELFVEPPEKTPLSAVAPKPFSWGWFFLGCDSVYKAVEGWLGPIRKLAVKKAIAWMFERQADSDGLGAIFPPMIYTAIVLRCLGYADDSPEMLRATKHLDDLVIEQDDTIRLQPCFSPIWDTALTLKALADSGVHGTHQQAVHGTDWLLSKECRRRGDWSITNPHLEAGGWYFEYANGFYPDTDDTAMVLMALARMGRGDHPAVGRGLAWLLGMQNKDGGWAAFDRDINKEILTQVPFADHNAMLDPSCPDITARVLEALGHFGYGPDHQRIQSAIQFIRRTQRDDGCWIGRWGVNYVYGTWQVLEGLGAIGFDNNDPMVRRAVAWLEKTQQSNGGWGESCRSYDEPELAGQGEVTASQTAWALLGLLAVGEADNPAVERGIEYLIQTQQPEGGWHEEHFTGTGFPRVFYLKYHMYSHYFPLMALARSQKLTTIHTKPTKHTQDNKVGYFVSPE